MLVYDLALRISKKEDIVRTNAEGWMFLPKFKKYVNLKKGDAIDKEVSDFLVTNLGWEFEEKAMKQLKYLKFN
jgi:hypothetical protein